MQVPGYPIDVENWWIDFAQRVFHCSNIPEKEAQIRARVQELTDLFTLDRKTIAGSPYDSPELMAAYGLFYFPETFVRTQFPLVELLQRGWTPPASLAILDLGSGTGAAGISAALALQDGAKQMEVTAVDRSAGVLEISQSIARHCRTFLPHLHWKTKVQDMADPNLLPEGPWDLIILSFSLNELATKMDFEGARDYLVGLLNRLTADGLLLLLEPALQETSERLERIRDYLVGSRSCFIWAPCLHMQRCPLLAKGKFWCHEVRTWNAPESLRFLNRHLHRTENVLKFSFLALGPRPPSESATSSFRLLSPWVKTKGKWIASGCAADGGLYDYQILKKEIAQENNVKRIKASQRGDIIVPGTKIHKQRQN